MLFFDQTTGNMTSSLKILLISTTVLSTAIVLKLSAPAITDFAVSDVPSLWSCVVSWLKPPYLYLVINGIIITIVASSKLQSKSDGSSVNPHEVFVQAQAAPVFSTKHGYGDVVHKSAVTEAAAPTQPRRKEALNLSDYGREEFGNYGHVDAMVSVQFQTASIFPSNEGYNDAVLSNKASAETVPTTPLQRAEVFRGGDYTRETFGSYGHVDAIISSTEKSFTVKASSSPAHGEEMKMKQSNEFVISKSTWTPSSKTSPEYSPLSAQKPPPSARFGHRRKASIEGGKAALGVSKSKRHDTLESTWKTITEGRAMPLTRHLRKSDTWERHHQHEPVLSDEKMTKSETFDNRTITPSSLSPSPASSCKLRKEPSLGQDELNKRVEAFIKKFNEEMRLQRQESLNQYMEMINRGAH